MTPRRLARQARLVRRARREARRRIETSVDPPRGSTRSRSMPPTVSGPLFRSCRSLRFGCADIVDARIFTLTNGKALDSFHIQDAAGLRTARQARPARRHHEHVITDSPAKETRDIAVTAPAERSRAVFRSIPGLSTNALSPPSRDREVNGDVPGFFAGRMVMTCSMVRGSRAELSGRSKAPRHPGW